MEQKELNMNVFVFARENGVPEERVRVIGKSELVEGRAYSGNCRNASVAVWNGNVFVYDRYKFGTTFKEEINHFEDDDGYDVFVPMEIINVQ